MAVELAHMVMMMTMMMNIDLDSDGFILGCVSCMHHCLDVRKADTRVASDRELPKGENK